jgi:hypothetical protein
MLEADLARHSWPLLIPHSTNLIEDFFAIC